ncbi:MAG: lipopolysaccharide assembly protein LapA domain-containing protein [Bacillota bacterium]
MQIVLVLILFLAFLLAALALQNQETMAIQIFFWRVFVPKILVILGAAFAGGLAVFLAGFFRHRGRRAAEEKAPAKPTETPLGQEAAAEEGRGANGR